MKLQVIQCKWVMNMYGIGDYVAHYKEGICEVVAIGTLNISCSDKKKDYYTLKPVYDSRGVLYTPVANERRQIREVITAQEAEILIKEMPKIEVLGISEEKKREALYKEALFKNECRAWISVIKTSYSRKMKRLSSGKKSINMDDKYLGMAEKFLFGELAMALGMSKEEVKRYITEKIEH